MADVRCRRDREHGAGMPRELAGKDACPTCVARPNCYEVLPQCLPAFGLGLGA